MHTKIFQKKNNPNSFQIILNPYRAEEKKDLNRNLDNRDCFKTRFRKMLKLGIVKNIRSYKDYANQQGNVDILILRQK